MNNLQILFHLTDIMEHHLCEFQEDIDEVETKKGKAQFKACIANLFTQLESMEAELNTINELD